MPNGRERPSRATVIASNPIEPTIPSESGTGSPEALGQGGLNSGETANPPAKSIVITVVRPRSCRLSPRRGGSRRPRGWRIRWSSGPGSTRPLRRRAGPGRNPVQLAAF